MTEPKWPNHCWGADFKGWFLTGDRSKCEPFTASDLWSRKVLECQAVDSTRGDEVWELLLRSFAFNGMPWIMRTDGGPPFGTAQGPISWLTVQLVKYGIQHEITRPGTPTDNGVHERMHRTLKQETAFPPAETIREQQRRFDWFLLDFNDKRPHEALGMRPPTEVWTPSPRSLPSRPPEVEYEGWFHVRRVRGNGEIKWKGQTVFICESLRKEPVGLEETADELYRVWYGPVLLGLIDDAGQFIRVVTQGPRTYPAYDPDDTWNSPPNDDEETK